MKVKLKDNIMYGFDKDTIYNVEYFINKTREIRISNKFGTKAWFNKTEYEIVEE